MSYPQHSTGMTSHPEIAEMRERLERTASSGSAIVVEGLILLAGVYAAISPWVVHFALQRNITVNNLIVGITVALIGFGLTLAPERMFRLAWVLTPLGVWLLISPWVVTATHGARSAIVWNNCWLGAIVAVLGLAAMGLTVGVARRGPR
ncbi:SPW repeat protein [Streptomyces sp. Li-HN-5-11]|uniref:SPW repeat protein n=1 Tax=Streptomyces sp. Li-HN-5-11 TaxID=3075432 RepID=UPI0028AFA0F1|nr:SPW repeat protein [Streptomyces sp. Li-HN-5-11]WNM32928.1 SPW repeat protein [Streptomyces sp. Li-HN-5-11]